MPFNLPFISRNETFFSFYEAHLQTRLLMWSLNTLIDELYRKLFLLCMVIYKTTNCYMGAKISINQSINQDCAKEKKLQFAKCEYNIVLFIYFFCWEVQLPLNWFYFFHFLGFNNGENWQINWIVLLMIIQFYMGHRNNIANFGILMVNKWEICKIYIILFKICSIT